MGERFCHNTSMTLSYRIKTKMVIASLNSHSMHCGAINYVNALNDGFWRSFYLKKQKMKIFVKFNYTLVSIVTAHPLYHKWKFTHQEPIYGLLFVVWYVWQIETSSINHQSVNVSMIVLFVHLTLICIYNQVGLD